MKKHEIFAIILVFIATIVTVFAIFIYKSMEGQNTITVLARAPEKGNWSPKTIKIKKGEKINLVIRNVDVTSHGFYIPAANILVREIKAGKVKSVDFTINEEGEYIFLCTSWCSDYHMQMRGKIIVR